MNKLKATIKANYKHLTDTNKLISDVILNHEGDFKYNIAALASKSFCSNSAIIKYINYFGYDSYKIFTNELNKNHSNQIESLLNSFQIVEDYFTKNTKHIDYLLDLLKKADKVYLFAAGQSQLSIIDFMLKSNKIERNKYIFEANMETQKLLISTISSDDLIIFVSNSGNARELIAFDSLITNEKILITNRSNSKLAHSLSKVYSLENNFESPLTFKDYSYESKYSLLYFFDKIFFALYGASI